MSAPPPANTTVVQEGGSAQAGAATPANTTVVQEKQGATVAGSGPPTGRKKFILCGPRRAARSDVEANRDTNPKLVRNMTRGRLCRLLTLLMLLGFLLSLLWPLALAAALGGRFPGKLLDKFHSDLKALMPSDMPKPAPTPSANLNDTLFPATTLTGPVAIETLPTLSDPVATETAPTPAGPVAIETSAAPIPAESTSAMIHILDTCDIDYDSTNGTYMGEELVACLCNFNNEHCQDLTEDSDPEDVEACQYLEENADFSSCPAALNMTGNSTILDPSSTSFFSTFVTTQYAATVTVPSTTHTVTTLMSASVTTSTAWFELPPTSTSLILEELPTMTSMILEELPTSTSMTCVAVPTDAEASASMTAVVVLSETAL